MFMNDAQIRHLRLWLDSGDNETWVRSEDVTDNEIREAVAETAVGGSISLTHVAARLATKRPKIVEEAVTE